MANWQEVASDPRFQKAPDDIKAKIQNDFFEQTILPEIPEGENVEAVRAEFLKRTTPEQKGFFRKLNDAFNSSSTPQSVVKPQAEAKPSTFAPSTEAVAEQLPSTNKDRIQKNRIAEARANINRGATPEQAAQISLQNDEVRQANSVANVTKPTDLSYAKELKERPARSLGDTYGDTLNAVAKVPISAMKGVVDVADLVTGDSVDLGVSQALGDTMAGMDEMYGSDTLQYENEMLSDIANSVNAGFTDQAKYLLTNPVKLADTAITTLGSAFIPAGVATGTVAMATKLFGNKLSPQALAKIQGGSLAGTIAMQNAAETFNDPDVAKLPLAERYQAASITALGTLFGNKVFGGGLEKAIADKFNKSGTAKGFALAGKEGGQEAVESLSGSLGEEAVSPQTMDLSQAGSNALTEGLVGTVLGGGFAMADSKASGESNADAPKTRGQRIIEKLKAQKGIKDEPTGEVAKKVAESVQAKPPSEAIDISELIPDEVQNVSDTNTDAGVVAGNDQQPSDNASGSGEDTLQGNASGSAGNEPLVNDQGTSPSVGESDTVRTADTNNEAVSTIDDKANEAATSKVNDLPEPTQAQKEAGNYKLGRIKVGGLDISVENPDQSQRKGVDRDGKEWSSTMNGHYGYVKGVKARAPDKEHVDVNVKPSTPDNYEGDVFIINQKDPKTGKFDEPKAYIGYANEQEAEQAYRSNYADDWQGFDGLARVPMAKFKQMLNDEKAFMKPVKAQGVAEESNKERSLRKAKEGKAKYGYADNDERVNENGIVEPDEVIAIDKNKSGIVTNRIDIAKAPNGKWLASYNWMTNDEGRGSGISVNSLMDFDSREEAIAETAKKAASEIKSELLRKKWLKLAKNVDDADDVNKPQSPESKMTLDEFKAHKRVINKKLTGNETPFDDNEIALQHLDYIEEALNKGQTVPVEALSQHSKDNLKDYPKAKKLLAAEQSPVIKELAKKKAKARKKSNAPASLLGTIKALGGLKLSEKQDITGEVNKFAPGGYNQLFRNDGTKTLKGMIESGSLDEYLPPSMRLETNSANDDAFDSTEAYDYLAERMRNGERVLPYDVIEELERKRFDENTDTNAAIELIANEFSEDDINAELQAAGYDEREAISLAQEFDTGSEESGVTGSQGTQESTQASAANNTPSEPQSQERGREQVTAIVLRRKVANELGKIKQFDEYLAAAKRFMAGEKVSPTQFKMAAGLFKSDNQLSNAYTQLAEMAKAPAKEERKERTEAIETYKQIIADAKTVAELQSIARDIQAETTLTDAQMQMLDDLAMDAIDVIAQSEPDTGKTQSLNQDSSWVIRDKSTGEVIQETYQKSVADKVNTDKYEAVPILQHLKELNDLGSKVRKFAEQSNKQNDLLGDNTKAKQAIADAQREKDTKRNTGISDTEGFTLTGSNSEADKAIAMGAQDLFAQPAKPSAPPVVNNNELDKLEKQLEKEVAKREEMQTKHMQKYRDGSATRAQTTSYNANIAWINESIADLKKQIKQLKAEKTQENPPVDEKVKKAQDDLNSALGDLGDIFGKNLRNNITPEQEQKLIPVLTRVFDAAFRLGYYEFKAAAKFVLDTIRSKISPDVADLITLDQLQGAYISMAGKYGDQATKKRDVVNVESIAEIQESENVTDERSGTDLERNSQDTKPADTVGKTGVQAQRNGTSGTRKPRVSSTQGQGTAQGSIGLFDSETVVTGERGNIEIYTGASPTQGSLARDNDNRGSGDSSLTGTPIEPPATDRINEVAQSGLFTINAQAEQKTADVIPQDRTLENIRATLPLLKAGQQEDVFKAETKFAEPDGYGMLFTNGTGTGKTFTGIGIIKRFANAGKNNIVVVAPNDKIIEDWQNTGKLFNLKLNRLDSTNDAGQGIVITTYANFGANETLADREWDLVVTDEAHYLAMDKDGTNTNALKTLRAITNNPDGASTRHAMIYREDMRKTKMLKDKLTEAIDKGKSGLLSDAEAEANDKESDRLSDLLEKAYEKNRETSKLVSEQVAASQGINRTRALFLSATPFAYEKTIDWANGYLFDYNENKSQDGASGTGGRAYNAGSNREQFFMEKFGYRMRYNKLTEPDAKVNRGLMQRQFNTWLKKRGTLSGRMLDVEADYDRKFVLIDSAIGRRIDEALGWFEERRKAMKDEIGSTSPKARAYSDVQKLISDKFDYLSRRYLLEAIKAKEVIVHVKEHMALGRKVVVFHDYKKGGGFNPFDIQPGMTIFESQADQGSIDNVIEEFRDEFADLIKSPEFQSSSPINAFQAAFPNVLLFNGDVPTKIRRANVAKFQDDNSGPQVILVQSAAGKEGISLHDTTGKHQRVLFNLGQPTQPTTSIQQEGRIYRTGQVTDAIFRYLNTGTNWERWAFATTIAQRASAAENLALGEQARALKDAFISGFEESDNYRAGMEGEGKGGKERDKAANEALTEYDRAKAFYYGTQKKNSKTKSQEGADYYATPEPVGLKMVELADIRPGERVLEPSAGHGAIARWFPEGTDKTAVEPSGNLRPRLAMVFDGSIIGTEFEDLNIINKYDAIIMNPPFGSAGKTAIDHVAKAARHLNDGGRIVALIPVGSTDQKFDKWFYEKAERKLNPVLTIPPKTVRGFDYPERTVFKGDTIETNLSWLPTVKVVSADRIGDGLVVKVDGKSDTYSIGPDDIKKINRTGARTEEYSPAEGLSLVADIKLPSVTFERAGTAVNTRIVVIEKSDNAPQQTNRDYTQVTDINDLFDRMETLEIAERAKPKEQDNFDDATAQVTAKELTKQNDQAAREREAKAQEAGAIAKTGEAYTFEISGDKLITNAPMEKVTTNKGKELEGVFITDPSIQLDKAREADRFAYYPKGKSSGIFVRLRHVVRPEGDASFSNSISQAKTRAITAQKALDKFYDAADAEGLTVDEFSKALDTNMEAFDTLVKELAAIPNDGFALQGKGANGQNYILAPSAKKKGVWQLSRFDSKGATGDTQFNSKTEAIKRLLDEAEISTVTDYDNSFSNAAPIFYSALRGAIEAVKVNKADRLGWKGMIKNLTQKGVKQDEIEWTGINEWLDLQTGSITKEQVLDYLSANGVQVEETMLGLPEPDQYELPDGWYTDQLEDGTWVVRDDIDDTRGNGDTENEAIEASGTFTNQSAKRKGDTKYEKYTVPGGENYRELLLTLPAQKISAADFNKWLSDTSRNINDYPATDIPILKKQAQEERQRDKRTGYKSSHFDQANILAHVRFDERTDADGNKVLFINEIQSDWGQDGKKKGFGDGVTIKQDANGFYRAYNREGSTIELRVNGERYVALTTEQAVRNALPSSYTPSVIPTAPFVTKTDAWVSLAIKRMMRYAVDNGFDKVAFINGQQAADLYDLSKQVDSIGHIKHPDGTYRVWATKDSELVTKKDNLKEDELADFVGKDIAEKIVKTSNSNFQQSISGIDLKVGGEGMRTFYDQIVPKVAKDVLKKLGGSIDSIDIGEIEGSNEYGESIDSSLTPSKQGNQLGFSITPAMRETVSGGLPLFRTGGTGSGLIVDDIKKAIANTTYGQEVDIYPTMMDAPVYVQYQAMSEGAFGVEGFFDKRTNRVAIVAENIKTMDRVTEVVRHELIGHYGMENMLNDADPKLLPKLINRVLYSEKSGNKTIQEIGQYVDKSQPGLSDNRRAKEIIAVMAERNLQNSIVKRVIDAIRLFLRKLGLVKGDVTDAKVAGLLRDAQNYLKAKGQSYVEPQAQASFSASPMKSTEANALRGEKAMNDALLNKADVKRAMYHNELGWIDFVYGDEFKGIKHIIRGRMTKDKLTSNEVYKLLTKDLVDTIAKGEVIRNSTNDKSKRVVIKQNGYEAILVKSRGGNGWLLTGFKIIEQVNQSRGATASDLRTTEPIRTRFSEGAVQNELSALAEQYVNNQDSVTTNRLQLPAVVQQNGDDTSFSNNPQSRLTPQWETIEESKMDNVVRALQDKYIDLKRVTQNIKQAGIEITDKWNAYLQEELFHGRTAKRVQDFLGNHIEPLIDDMRTRGVEMTDFEEYLWMRHAEERNIQIAKINPDMPDGGSGLDTEEAREYFAGLSTEQKANYEALAKRIDTITALSRQALVDYGLESAGTILKWQSTYKNYVPLMREDMEVGFGNGTGSGYKVKGNASRRATGSNRPVVDIISNLAQQYERNIIRGEKNRVSTALIGLATLNPNEEFWQVDTPPTITEVSRKTGLVETRTDPNYKNRPNVVVARVLNKRGEVVERSVLFNQSNDRAMSLAKAINNVDADHLLYGLGAISKVTRYFASINTQYNPIFGVVNITRDLQGSLLNLETTAIRGKQKEVMKNTPKALLGIYRDVRKQRKGQGSDNTDWAQLFEDFQKEGGQTGYRNMFSSAQERSEAMRKALDPTWWKNTKIGKVISAGGKFANAEQWMLDKAVKPIFDWLSDYNLALENAVRLSVYKVALDQGLTKQQAASIGKNISVNFNRKGQATTNIGALYAFFNASVQGTARIGETLTKRDAKGNIKISGLGMKIITGGLLLGGMQALALAMAGYDEDEPPDFVRDRNVVIPLDMFGLDQKYISIPMPLGFNAIPSIGRITTEWALSGFKDTPKRLIHMLDMMLDVTNPIGNAGLSVQTITPTFTDPMVALGENKDFTGRDIAVKDFNSLNPTPGHSRARDTATAFSKSMAYAINKITGGTEFTPGAFTPTPDQIDYLMGQVFGGVGREYQKIEQTFGALKSGEELPPYKIPLAGRFYGNAESQGSQGNKFYSNLREINKHEAEIKGRRETGQDVSEYIKDNPTAMLYKQANMFESTIKKMRKRKDALLEANADKEKIAEVENLITQTMQRFNTLVESREKADQPV